MPIAIFEDFNHVLGYLIIIIIATSSITLTVQCMIIRIKCSLSLYKRIKYRCKFCDIINSIFLEKYKVFSMNRHVSYLLRHYNIIFSI